MKYNGKYPKIGTASKLRNKKNSLPEDIYLEF